MNRATYHSEEQRTADQSSLSLDGAGRAKAVFSAIRLRAFSSAGATRDRFSEPEEVWRRGIKS